MELGPLDEKYATCGDAHFPITVLGNFSFAVGDLHQEVLFTGLVSSTHGEYSYLFLHLLCIALPCSSDVVKYLRSDFITYSDAGN